MAASADLVLHHEVSRFLDAEAELLDDARFDAWLRLFADDACYRMPIRTNRTVRERARSVSEPGELHLFDDSKETLSWRVAQMMSERHLAEDPPSRTRHLITNVRVASHPAGSESAPCVAVRSNFICYRNRLEDEEDLWVGERHDVLRRDDDPDGFGWLIVQRVVLLDQAVVLSKNLSVLL